MKFLASLAASLGRCRQKLDKLLYVYDSSMSKVRHTRQISRHGLKFDMMYNPYLLNSPLTENTILSWERKYDIQLPLEYRTFLLEIGNGGGVFFSPLLEADLDPPVEDWIICNDTGEEAVILPTRLLLCQDGFDETVLLLEGPQCGNMLLYYTQGSGGREDTLLLNTSFINWFEQQLDKQLQLAENRRDQADETAGDTVSSYIRHLSQFDLHSPAYQKGLFSAICTQLDSYTFDTATYLLLAQASVQGNAYPIQIRISERVLELREHKLIDLEAHQYLNMLHLIAQGYYSLKDQRGIPILQEYIQLSGCAEARLQLAELCLLFGQIEQAIQYATIATDNHVSHWIKGSAYCALQEMPLAIDEFRKGIGLNHYFSGNYEGLGDVYCQEADYQNALQNYQTALMCRPYKPTAILYKLAGVYAKLRKNKKAVEVFELLQINGGFSALQIERDPVFEAVISSQYYQQLII